MFWKEIPGFQFPWGDSYSLRRFQGFMVLRGIHVIEEDSRVSLSTGGFIFSKEIPGFHGPQKESCYKRRFQGFMLHSRGIHVLEEIPGFHGPQEDLCSGRRFQGFLVHRGINILKGDSRVSWSTGGFMFWKEIQGFHCPQGIHVMEIPRFHCLQGDSCYKRRFQGFTVHKGIHVIEGDSRVKVSWPQWDSCSGRKYQGFVVHR